MSELDQVVAVLKAAPSVAVLTHIHPEGDAIGSVLAASLALREAGKTAAAHVADRLTPGLATLPGAEMLVREAPGGRGYACYLVLDTSGLDRTGRMLEGRPADAIVVNVDHHPGNSRFGDVNWVEPEASSAGEMVYRILREGGFPISKATAANLYAAILTDTGSFHYGNSTPQALRVAADLVECGAAPEAVTHGLYDHHAVGEWRLLSEVLATLEVSPDGRLAWVEITLAAQARAGASLEVTEDFVQYPRIRGRSGDGPGLQGSLADRGEGELPLEGRAGCGRPGGPIWWRRPQERRGVLPHGGASDPQGPDPGSRAGSPLGTILPCRGTVRQRCRSRPAAQRSVGSARRRKSTVS